MGNLKYPLNGKSLTLEDLVSEYAFRCENIADPSQIIDISHANMMKSIIDYISTLTDSSILYTEYNTCIYDSSFNDLPICSIENSSVILYNDILKDWYSSFKIYIINKDHQDKADNAYELCYFPTVYSTSIRTEDNKKYKIIQAGDDDKFAPDRYIKFKNVVDVTYSIDDDKSNIADKRPILLFHYITDNTNSADNSIDTRISFNYKLDTGEATISYAIRLLYNIKLNINNNNIKCIKVDNITVNTDTGNLNIENSDISNAFNISTISNTDIIDFLLFGYNNNDKNKYCFINLNEKNEINLLFYPLLHDIKNSSTNNIIENIRTNEDKTLSVFAYKYLCNSYYRGNDRYYINNDLHIACSKNYPSNNATGTFNYLMALLLNDDITLLFNNSTNENKNKIDKIKNACYDVYDEAQYQNKETEDFKTYNTYWKVIYYCQLIAQSLLYYTGIILDAVYDVINTKSLYTTESSLRRCDIGANTNITEVLLQPNANIECLYGLPATNLKESDVIININIPIIIYTYINSDGTNTIYNKKWNITKIHSLLQAGLGVDVILDDTTGKLKENIGNKTQYEYMKVFINSNIPLITDNVTLNKYLYSNMGTYILDTGKSKIVSSLDPAYGIWNKKTNPAYNVSNDKYTNFGDDEASFLRGTIFAHIKYSGNKFIDIEFPVMRLLNYYTTTSIQLKRVISLFYINPDSLNSGNINLTEYMYNVNIKYNFQDSNTLSVSSYILVLNDIEKIYLYSYSGNAILYKFMSGEEVLNTHTGMSETYHNSLYINDNEIPYDKNIIKNDLYPISTKNITFPISIVFNNDDTVNKQTFNINNATLNGGYNIIIHNKCSKLISMLYKTSGNNEEYDNDSYIYWTNHIDINLPLPPLINNIGPGQLYMYSYGNELVLSKNNINNKNIFTFINRYGKIITDENSFSCAGEKNLEVYIYDTQKYSYKIINTVNANIEYINKKDNIINEIYLIVNEDQKDLAKILNKYLIIDDTYKVTIVNYEIKIDEK